MPVYALGDAIPQIDPTAYVHPDAVIIGAIVLGAESSGIPAKIKPDAVDPEVMIVQAKHSYVERAREYRKQLRRID